MLAVKLFYLVFYLTSVNGYNILAYFPLDLYSHLVPFYNVLDELVAQGHRVTLVSTLPLKHTSTREYEFIQLSPILSGTEISNPRENIGGLEFIKSKYNFCLECIEQELEKPELKNFIANDTSHYDVIVSEITFCGQTHVALAHKYNAPLVNFQPLGFEPAQFSLFGALAPPGAVVDVRLPYTDKDTTSSRSLRAYSSYMYLLDLWYFYTSFLPEMENIMVNSYKYPGSDTRPPLLPLLHNISLTLVEYDPRIIGLSFPVPANVLLIGGLHLRPAKQLPWALEQFMTAPGRKGVIFVCLGTLLQYSHFGQEVVDTFVRVLSDFDDYSIIWNVNVNVTVPDHILTGKWFPQEDILGHPSCKLFITHGGIHSAMEAVYYGVPVLIMPGFSDQFQNARVMEQKGMGLIIDGDTLTDNELGAKMSNVLQSNSEYRTAVQRLSKLTHSLPFHNLNTAVRWIEYVAENQGAPGLRPAATYSSVWEVLDMDLLLFVFGFVILALVIVILLLWCMCCLCRKCCKTGK